MGLGIKSLNLCKFRPVSSIKAKQVACGWAHTILLTDDGRILVAGDNRKGQLGLGPDFTDSSEFIRLESIKEPVKQVACGVWSSFVVLQSGKVLFWGQFRSFKKETCWIPTEIEDMEDVSKISIGHKHVLTLSAAGIVSGFGCNKYGQINFQVDKALDIFAGWNHSVLQVAPNNLLLVGKNSYNQLAHGDQNIQRNLLTFESEHVEDISVGSDHCLVLTNRRLLVWGWNEHGILGGNHTNQIYGPPDELKFNISRIKRICCGTASCFIITK